MTTITVPAHEHGVVRVFSLSMSADQAESLRNSRHAQADALGLKEMDPRGVEVFRIADLADFGLYGYLRDGVDAEEADLARDRTKLKALEGWVLLVHSSAFEGRQVEFTPTPELTLIGTYGRTQPDPTRLEVESDAAKPYSGSPTMTPPQPVRGRPGSVMVIAGLVLLLMLVCWWLLS
ncbi:hypothetical protein BOO69_03510 [Sulfitobacter alexandrii]|uniref:Aspartate carbamoyltransferase catalytic subunit n=2 Tax=Sulfitobacter alexandrii TaxID=1917485 RepID=A0A1J0WE55_9RHOB|nr:hypothetical protein BOO69_03510 [Sulfitobacter alexandrii]